MSGRRLVRSLLTLCVLSSASVIVAGGLQLKQVLRVDADGSNLRQVLQSDLALGFGGIDVDPVNRKIYWCGLALPPDPIGFTGVIRRANLNGGDIEEVVNGDVGVRVDPGGGKVYWSFGSDCDPCSSIHRANLDGSNVELLASGVSFTTIALDRVGGKIYWYDQGTIVVADLDGTGQQVLIDVGASVSALAVDSDHQFLYWVKSPPGPPGTDTLNRVGLDGTGNETIVTGLEWIPGLALDPAGDRLWWTEAGTGTIRRARLDGSEITTILSGLEEPAQIAYLVGEGQDGGRLFFISNPEDITSPVPASSTRGAVAVVLLLGAASGAILWRRSGK